MKNKKKTIIVGLLFLAVCMGVGYSILSKQLKIQGNVQSDPNFDVAITGIEKYDNGGFSASVGMGHGGESDPEVTEISKPTFTSTTANFNVRLGMGGSITYLVKIENTGSLNAKFKPVVVDKTGNANVKVVTPVNLDNKTLNSGDILNYFVIISYSISTAEGYWDDSTTESNISITIDAEQEPNDLPGPLSYVTPTLMFNNTAWNSFDNRFQIAVFNKIDDSTYGSNKKLYESIDDEEYTEVLYTVDPNVRGAYIMTYGGGISYAPSNDLNDGETHKIKLKLIENIPLVGGSNETIDSNELTVWYFHAAE